MGSFEKYLYSDGAWTDSSAGRTWLSISVHDSDIATIEYSPAPQGLGLVYLGFQPRDYFEDPAASEDVDLEGESGALAAWAQTAVSSSATSEQIRPLLAENDVEEPDDDFVEDTVIRLLHILGVPLPADLELST